MTNPIIELLSDSDSSTVENYKIIDFQAYRDEFVDVDNSELDKQDKHVYKVLDLNEHFRKCFEKDKNRVTILTELDISNYNYKEILDEKIFSKSNVIDHVPQCKCGKYVGFIYEDTQCDVCNEIVSFKDVFRDRAFFSGWLKSPDAIPHGFIHPRIYSILTSSWLCQKLIKGQRPVNYLDYVLDPNLECDIPELLPLLEKGRGLNYAYNHFDDIISYFFHVFPPTAKKIELKLQVVFALSLNMDRIFTKYLPILPSTLHSIGTMGDDTRLRTNKNCQYVKSSIAYLAEITSNIKNRKLKTVESIAHKAYVSYMTYMDDVAYNQLSVKNALPRKHIFAARLNYTCRGVIVPHLTHKEIDEITLPWQQIVEVLKHDILGKLLRLGYSLNDALMKHFLSLQRYDEVIDKILTELINECPYKGLPCIFNRNPTIYSGSAQMTFVTSYFKDPTIHTIGMPLPSVYGYNADFDGDNMTVFLLREMRMVEYLITLHSSYLLLGRNAPEISNVVKIPQQMLMTLNNYLGMFNRTNQVKGLQHAES